MACGSVLLLLVIVAIGDGLLGRCSIPNYKLLVTGFLLLIIKNNFIFQLKHAVEISVRCAARCAIMDGTNCAVLQAIGEVAPLICTLFLTSVRP